jgi:hypothetical protein
MVIASKAAPCVAIYYGKDGHCEQGCALRGNLLWKRWSLRARLCLAWQSIMERMVIASKAVPCVAIYYGNIKDLRYVTITSLDLYTHL